MYTRTFLNYLAIGAIALSGCSDDPVSGENNDNIRTSPDAGSPNNQNTSDAGETSSDMDQLGEDSGGPVDDAGEDGEDMGADTSVEPDMGDDTPDMTTEPPCSNIATGQTFDLDPDDVYGEYFADAAFDGEGVWVIYTRPANSQTSLRSTYAVRVECDGTVGQPIRLSQDNGRDNIHATIAAGGATTYAVWVSDEGGSKKYIMYQALKSDGTASLPTPADVTPMGETEVISDLVWEIDVAALPGESAVVVGASGPFGEQQVVAQRFLADGSLDGNAFFPYSDKDVEQTQPTVTADDAGTMYVAWTRTNPMDSSQTAVLASVPQNATEAIQSPPPVAGPFTGDNPLSQYADEAGPNGEYFLSFMDTSSTAWNIVVRDGSDFSTAKSESFGTPQRNNFRPDVAGGPEGGVVAWYRYSSSPVQSTVMVNWFEVNASGDYTAAAAMPITTNAPGRPQYGPRIVHVAGRTYFLTWSEGTSGDAAEAKGRFIQF
jgi:hypothetical protein